MYDCVIQSYLLLYVQFTYPIFLVYILKEGRSCMVRAIVIVPMDDHFYEISDKGVDRSWSGFPHSSHIGRFRLCVLLTPGMKDSS